MPAKNSSKSYLPNAYYHIYNRGVEKRKIYLDERDYGVFLSYIKEYLSLKNVETLTKILENSESSPQQKADAIKALRMNNFFDDITLVAYCLMPNHFHLLIHQKSETAIDTFMNSLATRYTMYFNRRYKRVGTLYQSVYKAVLVQSNEQLLYLTEYIHRNPLKGEALKGSPETIFRQPSSYPEYLGKRKTEWVHPEEILKYFSKTNPRLSYKSFVMGQETLEVIQDVALDI